MTCFHSSLSLFPDDHSRVRLQAIEGEQSSDYINANYIDVSMDTRQCLHSVVNVYSHWVCVCVCRCNSL